MARPEKGSRKTAAAELQVVGKGEQTVTEITDAFRLVGRIPSIASIGEQKPNGIRFDPVETVP